MNKIKPFSIWLFSLLVFACGQNQHTNNQELKIEFQSPSQQSQPRTWWRWLNGNVSKEGVTKDLEAIKAKGMKGVTFFNLGSYYPEGDVVFMSDEWLEMFDFAVDECERLGLDFSFQMCDGWGASGGPWVTKDHAMKFVTSSKINIEGGQTTDILLPQPFTKLDYYKDIKVFAFPAIDTSTHYFTSQNVSVKFNGWVIDPDNLVDGSRYTYTNFGYHKDEKPVIDFELNQPYEFSAINLFQGPRETVVGPQRCKLWYSNDGRNYHEIIEFSLDDIKGIAEFTPVTAKYFRLEVTEWTPSSGDGNWAFLSEVEFLSPENITKYPKINDFDNKASVWHRRRGLLESKEVPASWEIKKDDILDITGYYKDGKLMWDAPEGHWTVVRIGYTLTGKENGPATEQGTGLECDKLSKEAVDVFYDGYAGKLLKRNQEHSGKTISRLFADSFEALAQNWTPEMGKEFEKRAGYSIDTYLLIFSGEIVESVETSERFLHDFRKVLSEMLADNYYAHLNQRCHEDNVGFVAQIAGEQQMLANPILYASKVDFPATEFWIDGKFENTYLRPNGSVFDAISSTHLFNKAVIPTEAFTMKHSDFSVTPATLKPIADRAYCYGINQFEMHTYIHQPDDKLPGWQHYMFGISWGRKLTWWKYADQLTQYFSRVQSILQKGTPKSKILVYTGEQVPNSLEYAYKIYKPEELIPYGYGYDIINSYELLASADVKDGVITLSNGLSYNVLVIPPHESMTSDVINKIKEFADDGAIIIGQKPVKSYGLKNADENDAYVSNLANEIWDNPNVYTSQSVNNVLSENQILPDFAFSSERDDAEIVFIHKEVEDTDVYFLSNQTGKPLEIKAKFLQAGKIPELWNPETGDIFALDDFAQGDKITTIPIKFGSMQSWFVVFKTESTPNIAPLPVYDSAIEVADLNDNWMVAFDTIWGGPDSIVFDSLLSWTNHTMDGVKFYSGTAVYKNSFGLDSDVFGDESILRLDLGDLGDVAEVFINGEKVKTIIFPDYTCDITEFARPGTNTIEVHVTNTWNNRIAGDDLNPGKERFTFYPVKGYSPNIERRQYNQNDLLESGLMGPVKIYSIE